MAEEIISIENNKGRTCKKTKGLLCQEGFCSECWIAKALQTMGVSCPQCGHIIQLHTYAN